MSGRRASQKATRRASSISAQLHGDPSSRLKVTLKDVQARNEYGAGEYKTYRGEQYPVYVPPPGHATLERRRRDRTWSAWIPVAPSAVSDALALLMQSRPLYVSLHERKVERHRWIVSVTLQSTDPAEE